MKKAIHPKYILATVTCACGATFKVRSTKKEYRLEICSQCHPFFTGQQKFVDTAGRIDKFRQRYAKGVAAPSIAPAQPTVAAPASEVAEAPAVAAVPAE